MRWPRLSFLSAADDDDEGDDGDQHRAARLAAANTDAFGLAQRMSFLRALVASKIQPLLRLGKSTKRKSISSSSSSTSSKASKTA